MSIILSIHLSTVVQPFVQSSNFLSIYSSVSIFFHCYVVQFFWTEKTPYLLKKRASPYERMLAFSASLKMDAVLFANKNGPQLWILLHVECDVRLECCFSSCGLVFSSEKGKKKSFSGGFKGTAILGIWCQRYRLRQNSHNLIY